MLSFTSDLSVDEVVRMQAKDIDEENEIDSFVTLSFILLCNFFVVIWFFD